MCNPACLAYGRAHLTEADVRGRRVIEVGSRNVNGSLRAHVTQLAPASYLGVDIEEGPGVDEVCDAEDLVTRYGAASFEVVICTEVLEHVREWRRVVSNLKRLLGPGGVLLITTRSYGFKYHAFPYDFWRYEVDDMNLIFSDMIVEDIESDPSVPGVFLRVRRPDQLVERDLESIELYSMVQRRRCRDLSPVALAWFVNRRRAMRLAGRLLPADLKEHVRRLVRGSTG